MSDYRLERLEAGDFPASFGPKACSLSALMRAGFRVPDGFVLSPSGVELLLAEHDGGPRNRALWNALRDWAHRYSVDWNEKLICRSSGIDEDSSESSGAGRYRTILNISSFRELRSALLACARALRERGPRSVGALVVQRQIDARAAGVLIQSTEDDVLVEANWGQGYSVVSGLVSPDRVTNGTVQIGPKSLVVLLAEPEIWPGDWLPLPGSRNRDVKVLKVDDEERLVFGVPTDRLREQLCLSRGRLRRLLELGVRLFAWAGSPTDVEWCLDKAGQVWIVQARPLTAQVTKAPLAANEVSDPNGLTLRGIPAAFGRAAGVAHLGGAAKDSCPANYVLIVSEPTPSMLPQMASARAIVTEIGGLLCHAAIVARELGIPAVVGVPGACSLITEGTPLVVDGWQGTVRLSAQDDGGATQERQLLPPAHFGEEALIEAVRLCPVGEAEPAWLQSLREGTKVPRGRRD